MGSGGGGLVYGIAAGAVCFWAVNPIKQKFKIDDSLEMFAVHGVGGAPPSPGPWWSPT